MSSSESKEHALQMAKEQDVKFIRLWFSDILGNLKRAAELGYTFYVAPELEYFYFANPEGAGRAKYLFQSTRLFG